MTQGDCLRTLARLIKTEGELMKKSFCKAALAVFLITSIQASAQYASIAYSTSTGSVGVANQQPDEATAKQVAIQSCNATDCKAVGWVSNSCMALATNFPATKYGWGWDSDLATAESKSMRYCLLNNPNCNVIEQTCSEG
jgi:hypothetical protein